MEEIRITHIPLHQIDVSGTNPRKTFDQVALEELAQSIYEKGVLQPIIVREKKSGRYEIVAGERRYRAAKLVEETYADRNSIPAIIRELSEEEVLEIQIIENLQRKDVHPMEEALGFLHLTTIKKMDVKEIAARVGKNPSYVAQRLKFNDLIEPIQKVFYNGQLKVKDALVIAAMSVDTQEAFYKEEIKGESGEIEFSRWSMDKYRHQLNNAPFDIENPDIDKKAGACTGCPYNSGAGNLLFPEEAQNPICRNPRCYENKCELNFKIQLESAIADPTMVLVSGWWNESISKEWKELKKRGLEVISKHDYTALSEPSCPEREDFEGDNETTEEDEADYQRALAEYQDDMRKYYANLNDPKWIRALKIDEADKGEILYIKLNKKSSAAVKSNTGAATPSGAEEAELKAEIERIKAREKRSKELDSSKIYDAIKPHFNPHGNASVFNCPLRPFEMRAMAMAIYEKLDYSSRDEFRKLFKIDGRKMDLSHVDDSILLQMSRYFFLQVIPPPVAGQYGYDYRLNMAYTIAEEMFPSVVADIKAKQIDIATKRAERADAKIKSLQKKIAELKKVAQDAKKLASDAYKSTSKAKKESEIKEPAATIIKKGGATKKGKGVKALLPDA